MTAKLTKEFLFNILDHYNDPNDKEIFYFNDDEKEDEGPVLEIYGTDLTALAREGKLEQCFGREQELMQVMEILVRRQKNNPVLVGDAGVGKTAIVELFATKIVNNLVPFVLEGRTLISLDLARIVAGARYRGEFELRFQKIIDEVFAQPNIIIFIDEIHNIADTGSAEGSLDAGNILKPVLSRSGFQCIGATTTKEYEIIEKDPALNRRFQPIRVEEPTIENTVYILYGLRPSLEAFHNVEILPGALRLSVELASRYIQDRFLPDKAIDLVDRAASREVIKLTNLTEGSVISSVVNSGLQTIGKLRMEAFRRGDIPSEFIFQEIENAYRNFMLRWVENPLSIPDKADILKEENIIRSPISDSLFDDMKLSVLKRVDQLLFASNKPQTEVKKNYKVRDLSSIKNQQIYSNFYNEININSLLITPNINLYRLNLFLYADWIEEKEIWQDFLKEKYLIDYFLENLETIKKLAADKYFRFIRQETKNVEFYLEREDDFFEEDMETIEECYEILSELEQNRINVVQSFLLRFKPILRKGVVQSLKYSSKLDLSDDELSVVYSLLGYFSTDTGRKFLSKLDDPELIRKARQFGNFSGLKKRITQKEIKDLLSDITGIPIQSLSAVESEKLLNLEKTLHNRVIGQEDAISAIAKAIRRSRLGIQNPNRPIASFLFCGPTGVGKTEVTKALAISMFGSENDMIRFDMSEFMEKFTISRLIGSPPGYVGYEDGGQLTDAVRRKPYSVVLLDEVEKAHPDILNILLQILEDGRLTDSQKRLIPFENTVIIMTSNAAAEEIQEIIKTERQNTITSTEKNEKEDIYTRYEDDYSGLINLLKSPINENYLIDLNKELKGEFKNSFRNLKNPKIVAKELRKLSNSNENLSDNEEVSAKLKSAVIERLSSMFLPEFLNRLDDIIIFQPLKSEELRKICDIMINQIVERVKTKQVILSVTERVKTKLTREGYNPAFGARPLRRLVIKYIEDLISESLLKSPISKKTKNIKIDLNEKDQVIVKNIDEILLVN
jgi:ATP-dependent Clp protease ATP-binding subunit ClpA